MHAGVIISYELWMWSATYSRSTRECYQHGQYDPLDPLGLRTVLPPPATSCTVDGLEPFTDYQLHVVSENALGRTASDVATGRTAEAGKTSR